MNIKENLKQVKDKFLGRNMAVFWPAMFFLLLTSSTILVIAIARKINQPVEYKPKATSETAADACRLSVSAGYCGGEASYCEGNSFYTACQTVAGGRDIGQRNCPSTYHCCDPSAPTLTPIPREQKPTCQTICSASSTPLLGGVLVQHSCGTPVRRDNYDCKATSTHIGDTSDCSGNCYCAACYPFPNQLSPVPSGSTPRPTITPAPVRPTCQGLLLNWQKTLENDAVVVSPGSPVKVSYTATFSSYAKGAIRLKGTSVLQNTHFDIQSGGSFTAPTTAGVYHVTLNIYDSSACKVFCSGGGVWYTTNSTAPDHCLTSGIWADQGPGCMGCQGWIEVVE